MNPVYMDNLATTPTDPRVLATMVPFFIERMGNPASRTHAFGWDAADAVERARSQVASLIGARSAREVVFTSGATESINLAIKGVVAATTRGARAHVVTCATEHRAGLDCCRALQEDGVSITQLPVGPDGQLDPAALAAALRPDTTLVSLMAANNEIGSLHPLEEIGQVIRRHGIPWHCDAAQAVGKVPVDVQRLGVDLLSLSAHKIYGPKGVGALYVRGGRPRVRLRPLFHGGGQERGLRAGTLNVPGIVGLGAACALCAEGLGSEALRIGALRDRLRRGLQGGVDGIHFNGDPDHGLPGCLHASFEDVDGSALALAFRDVALSSGSACTSGDTSPSHVLRAIGLSDRLAHASLRFGIGRFNGAEDVDRVIDRVRAEVSRLRAAG